MQYTPELLEKHLGKKYDPEATYIIETHRGAANRALRGTHKIVGNVPDFAPNETGTMIVMVAQDTKPATPGSGISSVKAPANQPTPQRSMATPVPTVLPVKVAEPAKITETTETTEPLATEEVKAKVVVQSISKPKTTTKPGTTITRKPSGGPKR